MRFTSLVLCIVGFALPAWAQTPPPPSIPNGGSVTATDRSRISELFSQSMLHSLKQCEVPDDTTMKDRQPVYIDERCRDMHFYALELILKDLARCAVTHDAAHCRQANNTGETIQRLFIMNSGEDDPITE